MYDLALHGGQEPVPLREIAARQDISEKYLEQLFLKLRRAGLIRSVRGPGGGYLLARKVDKIRMYDILKAVEGPLTPVFCTDNSAGKRCRRAKNCAMRQFWMELGDRILECLKGQSLGDICRRSSKGCPSR
jgi:Rrf2 family protein